MSSIIELSVKLIRSDGTSPFESRLTVTADMGAELVAAAWLKMMQDILKSQGGIQVPEEEG